jgi:hypothetical protein
MDASKAKKEASTIKGAVAVVALGNHAIFPSGCFFKPIP